VDSIAQTKAMARYQGLDFVALTDHDTLSQNSDPDFYSEPDIDLIPGVEWTTGLHAGVINPSFLPPPELSHAGPPGQWPSIVQSVIDRTHAGGGAFIAYHPTEVRFPWVLDVRGIDAVEIWNSFWGLGDNAAKPSSATTVSDFMRDKGLTAAGVPVSVPLANAAASGGNANDQAVAYWEELLERGERVSAVACSDRHDTLLPGYPSTWIYGRSSSTADVVDALRSGRTMVTAGPRGPRVTFEADGDGDGAFETMIGDSLPVGAPVTLRVRVEGAQNGLVRIVRRRLPVHEETIPGADHVLTLGTTTMPGDWFRVDVFVPIDWSIPVGGLLVGAIGSLTTRDLVPILSAFGTVPPVPSNQPVFDFDEQVLRILSVDVHSQLRYARAALTSPIYAGR
jgi:hypothetical protein